MTGSDPLRELLARPRLGSGLGVHRFSAVLDALDGPWLHTLDAIKITGSNGKGSTATMVAAILGELGLTVGLYTSPHLWRFNERIQIGGAPIDDDSLHASAAWFNGFARDYLQRFQEDEFSAFEAGTAVALHAFARAGVDVVVAEAGIGGRYDPTRLIPGQICGLTTVDLEHTALLGATEEQIAFDKADLCPSGGQLVVGSLDHEVVRRLVAYARLRRVALVRVEECSQRVIHEESGTGTRADLVVDGLRLDDLIVRAAGRHQLDNAAVASMLVQRWIQRCRDGIPPSTLAQATVRALGTLRLPGRLEQIHEDPRVIIDVGHTPAATRHAAAALEAMIGGAPILLVAGVSQDREPDPVLAPLAGLAHHVIATRAHHRGAPAAQISAAMGRLGVRAEEIEVIDDAIARAMHLACTENLVIVVGGGLFLAIEAACVLRGGDPRALPFL